MAQLHRLDPESSTPGAYIGIDPGAKGAIALIHGDVVSLFRPPMRMEKRGKSAKAISNLTDMRELFTILAGCSSRPRHAYIERVWGVRGQGASTAAALAHHRCALECACEFSDIPYSLVSPQRWKADLGLYKLGKAAAIDLACSVWPQHHRLFAPVRGQRDTEQCIGNADAALIAHWGRTYGTQGRLYAHD